MRQRWPQENQSQKDTTLKMVLESEDDVVTVGGRKFSFVRKGDEWTTKAPNINIDGIVHPYFQLPEMVHEKLCQFITSETPGDVKEITCHYEVHVLRINTKEGKQIFRCHPEYRGASWFDWMMVDYKRGKTTKTIPAMVYLWMKPKTDEKELQQGENIFGLIHALSSWNTPMYQYLNCFSVDSLHDEADVICFKTSVSSTACVIPNVSSQSMNDYIVIPPMSDWHKIGWCTTLDREIKDKFNEDREASI